MMKRKVAAALFASLLALSAMAPAALADPDCTGPNKPGACGGGQPHHGPQ
jgi:Spy/CpxP family protein refolding chaperone